MAVLQRSSTVPKSFVPGKKEFFNLPSTSTAPPIANAFGVRPWQLSGIFTASIPFEFPAGAAGFTDTVTVVVPIKSGWPSPVALKSSDLGSILVSVSQARVASNWLVGIPQIQLTWGVGPSITPASAQASPFTLSPGNTYIGPVLTIILTGYLIAANGSPADGLLTVQANLYGNSTT
jgi:hypothetical protein